MTGVSSPSDDAQVSVDTLREDIASGEVLVTVHADDVRAVLDQLARLRPIEQRAREVLTQGGVWGNYPSHSVARFILGTTRDQENPDVRN